MTRPLLLLHGALGASDQFQVLTPLLSGDFDLHALDLPGHGATASDAPFRIEHFADAVRAYLDEHAIESADFTGIIGLPLLAVGRLLREVGLLPGPP